VPREVWYSAHSSVWLLSSGRLLTMAASSRLRAARQAQQIWGVVVICLRLPVLNRLSCSWQGSPAGEHCNRGAAAAVPGCLRTSSQHANAHAVAVEGGALAAGLPRDPGGRAEDEDPQGPLPVAGEWRRH